MEPNRSQIRGKDLAGAIKVMPMGLDAAIKKRVSGEFKSEQRGGMVSFSEADQSQPGPMKMESRQMATCQEEVSEVRTSTKGLPSPFQQAGFKSAPLAEPVETAQHQAHSQQMSSTSSSTQKSMMSSSSSSSSKSVTMQSSSKVQKEFGETRSTVSFQPTQLEPAPQLQHQEIGQDSLKTQLVSCISDLEKDREFVDFNKENKPLSLASPPQAFSPGPSFSPAPKQDTFSPGPKADMFSPPPLEPIQPLAAASALPALPARNEVRNGLSDFLGAGAKTAETSSLSQYESSSFQQTSVQESSFQQTSTQQSFVQEHGTNGFEESGSLQASGSSTSLLQKIMTPAPTEYDSGSLKRRDPRKMFTDSSFYSAKHHPTVADQVEMAHKLSSAMFNDKNKSTKGQQMFLSRVQNAGEEDLVDGEPKAPSLKHVMNSGGRMVEWGDLDQEDLPNVEAMANHLVPNLNTPDPIAESLNAEAGKGGELFAKRRKRAENWVVDDSSLGSNRPSQFADKFVQEQTDRQSQFAKEQFSARQQKEALLEQQQMIQQNESSQQQSIAKQQFTEQQQVKQNQSAELRRQTAEAQFSMESQADYPDNFKHTSLKARSNTPTLDLSCHNVQGINVWANTAPRGWGGAAKPQGLPRGPAKHQGPPELSICPATPSLEQEQAKLEQQQQDMIRQQQEQMVLQHTAAGAKQQQEQMMRQEQAMQQQQLEIERQQEEQFRVQQEYEQLQREKEKEMQHEQMMLQQEEQRQMEMHQQQEMHKQQEMHQQEEMYRQQEMQQQEEMYRQQEMQQQLQQQEMQRQQQLRQQEMQQQQEMQRLEQQRQAEMQQQVEVQRQQEMQKQQIQQQELQRQQQQQQQQQQQELQRQQQQQQQQTKLTQQQQQQQQSSSQFSQSSTSTTTTGMSEQQSTQQQQSFQQQQISHQQSSSQSTAFSQQQEVYEATEVSGASRGYQVKGQDETGRRSASAMAQDSGLFGGIGADNNSLVGEEFDYKKHSVKDLAQHFALVKPRTEIQNRILPQQQMHNGEQGPTCNYLGGKQDFASQQQVFTKKEVSAESIEASKQAYELKKKQQQLETSSTSSSTTTSQQSSVVMREKKTEEQKSEQADRRRASISSALLMDPAAAHAQAGIIDPSAILRGEQQAPWAQPCPAKTRPPLQSTTSTTTCRPRQATIRPFSTSTPSQPPATQPHQNQPAQTSANPAPTCPVILESAEQSPPPVKYFKAGPLDPTMAVPSPVPQAEYQATVETSATQFPQPALNIQQSNLENISPNIQTTNPALLGSTNTNAGPKQSVIQTMLKNTGCPPSPCGAAVEVALPFLDLPRSTASTPGPTVPFPPLDSLHCTAQHLTPQHPDSIVIIPPSPTPSLGPRAPILVTTRPSSVSLDHRSRHVSKEDLARMMAELNAPLPPMVQIPDEIRASPLIFSHGGLAAVSINPTLTKTSSTSSQSSTASLAINSTTRQTFQ